MSDLDEDLLDRPLMESLKIHLEKDVPEFRVMLASPQHPPTHEECLMRSFSRVLEPWPEWVLRIASELLKVYFPRIEREKIFDSLKILHELAFEQKPTCAFKHLLMNFGSKDLFFAIGHLQKHADAFIKEFEKRKPTLDQNLQDAEPELKKGHATFRDFVIEFLQSKKPEDYFETMRVMIEANQTTYDSEGRLRETTATPIYMRIFFSWVRVESLSGVTQLCHFLDPLLGNVDAEAKLDRVKKIVQRTGISFKPFVSRDKPEVQPVPVLL